MASSQDTNDQIPTIKIDDQSLSSEDKTPVPSVGNNADEEAKEADPPHSPELSPKRWFMMFLFAAFAFNISRQRHNFQLLWLTIQQYYNCLIYLFDSCHISLIPFIYLINTKGTRYTMIVGALGIMAVDVLNFVSVELAQLCLAIFLPLSYGLIGRFAAEWYGINGISTAVVIGLLSNEFGTLCGESFPNMRNIKWSDFVRSDVSYEITCVISATMSIFVFLLIWFYYQSNPKLPPSISQMKKNEQKKNFKENVSTLKYNGAFLIFVFTFSVNYTIAASMRTLLNDLSNVNSIGKHLLYIEFLPSSETMGEIVGAFVIAAILDKTHSYKAMLIFSAVGSLISIPILKLGLEIDNAALILTSGFATGFFVMGYLSSAIQSGIELTYPVPEEISVGISFVASGILYSCIPFGYIHNWYGSSKVLITDITLSIIVVIGTFCIPNKLNRMEAEKDPKQVMIASETPASQVKSVT